MRTVARTVRLVGVTGALVLIAGCGGGGHADAGAALAAKACQSNGAQAATLAAQATAQNSKYATLAADERAAAAAELPQQSTLTDGNATDDASTASLIGSQAMGTAAGQKVLSDCVNLGLSVLPGNH